MILKDENKSPAFMKGLASAAKAAGEMKKKATAEQDPLTSSKEHLMATLEIRFGGEVPEETAGYIRTLDSQDKVKALFQGLLKCDTMDDFTALTKASAC
ncbi:hypothetical protein MTBBW1_2030031 [Desulfamplus magnetovallimortis]|uniref:Uncharacterized protein n=1 Tax=Desulfamplus magnetovallimortis TaxID=1246637 RepID=A0A1W1HBR0_9BACT|nr:hypothetical protein [Desulfamplus magnetovallimortis]SLM29941.1 hypothetical protein MTBBW1_2030031 [Desulfamplus magnetovallimortis]